MRLARAGALQNSQSPAVAVVDGDGATVEPPLRSALVSIDSHANEISASLVNSVAAQIQISTIPR